MQSVICIATLYKLSRSTNKNYENDSVKKNAFRCRLKTLVSVIVRRLDGSEFHAAGTQRESKKDMVILDNGPSLLPSFHLSRLTAISSMQFHSNVTHSCTTANILTFLTLRQQFAKI